MAPHHRPPGRPPRPDHGAHDHGARARRGPLAGHDHGGHDHGGADHGGGEREEYATAHLADTPYDDDALDEAWDDEGWDEDEDEDEESLKDALGLGDVLPALRLPPDAELAAAARAIPLLGELAAVARTFGGDGDGEPALSVVTTQAEVLEAVTKVLAKQGVAEQRLPFVARYALIAGWAEWAEPGRIGAGEVAGLWADGDDESTLEAWAATYDVVMEEAMCIAASNRPGQPEVDFHQPGAALSLLLFLGRREGLTMAEISELVTDVLTEDAPARVKRSWMRFATAGDPAAELVAQLTEVGALTEPAEDGAIRLTPLALRELRLELLEDVEIPLLADDPLQVPAEQLIALVEVLPDEDFDAECAAWIAARGPRQAATELLEAATSGEAAERMLAVTVVTDIGADAEPAWRRHQNMLPLRPYARVAIAHLQGLEDPAELPEQLALEPVDLCWLAADVLSAACDGEDTDSEELAEALEAVRPPDLALPTFFSLLTRTPHPDITDILEHIGDYHPDKAVAKEARRVLYKASQRQAGIPGSRQRHR